MPLTSCLLSHDYESAQPVELRCRPILEQTTRTTPTATNSKLFPRELDFGLRAYALPRDRKWSEFSPAATTFLHNTRFAAGPDNLWYPPTSTPWDYNSALAVVAYAPFSLVTSYDLRNGLVVDNFDSEANPNTDILYSDLLTDLLPERNDLGVDLPFHHALAKVDVKARTVLVDPQYVRVKQIVFEQLRTQGSFVSLPNPTWYTFAEATDVVVYDSAEGWLLPERNDLYIDESSHLFIPQTGLSRIRIVADIMRGGLIDSDFTLTSDPFTVAWQAGKYYTYSLEISADAVKIYQPNTSDFADQEEQE